MIHYCYTCKKTFEEDVENPIMQNDLFMGYVSFCSKECESLYVSRKETDKEIVKKNNLKNREYARDKLLEVVEMIKSMPDVDDSEEFVKFFIRLPISVGGLSLGFSDLGNYMLLHNHEKPDYDQHSEDISLDLAEIASVIHPVLNSIRKLLKDHKSIFIRLIDDLEA